MHENIKMMEPMGKKLDPNQESYKRVKDVKNG